MPGAQALHTRFGSPRLPPAPVDGSASPSAQARSSKLRPPVRGTAISASTSTWSAPGGATVILTLIEDHEIAALGVGTMASEVAARGMTWLHLLIKDVSVPTPACEAAYDRVRDDLHRRLIEGEAVLVHCKGSLGKAGLVCARLLVETGHARDEAIDLVRSARPERSRPGRRRTMSARKGVELPEQGVGNLRESRGHGLVRKADRLPRRALR